MNGDRLASAAMYLLIAGGSMWFTLILIMRGQS